MKEYVVTIMAHDRVGIVRDVSTALANLSGNITHVSQTVMRGHFTLILSVQMPDDRTQLQIRQAVERMGEVGELEVNVRPFVESTASESQPSERFTLSLKGNDRPGIISLVSSYLAQRQINIDDFYAYVIDGGFVMLLQVSISVGVDVEGLQSDLEQVGKEYGLTVHLQHENIFSATSNVRPVMYLQRKD